MLTFARTLDFFSLLSASDPEAAARCGTLEKFRVWVQAIPLILTPLFAFGGAFYAIHDTLVSRSGVGAGSGAFLSGFWSAGVAFLAAGIYATLLFAMDWMIVASLDGPLGAVRKVQVVAPRLLLAGIAAFLISVPVKVMLFEDEINRRLFEEKRALKRAVVDTSTAFLGKSEGLVAGASEEIQRIAKRLEGTPDSPEYLAADASVERLAPRLERLDRSVAKLVAELSDLKKGVKMLPEEGADATALNEKLAVVSSALKEKRAERAAVSSQLFAAREALSRARLDWRTALLERLEAAEEERRLSSRDFRKLQVDDRAGREREMKEIDDAHRAGFVGKVVVLSKLASESATHASLLLGVYLLFFLIDAAPALVKLLSERSEYQVARSAVAAEREDLINGHSNARTPLHAAIIEIKRLSAEGIITNLNARLSSLGPALDAASAAEIRREAQMALDLVQ